jgi:hypothetical protein
MYEFYGTSSENLGHLLIPDGMSDVLSKVEAIGAWPQTPNVKHGSS